MEVINYISADHRGRRCGVREGIEYAREWKNLGEVNLMNYKFLFVDKRQGIHTETSACNVISLEQETMVFPFKVRVGFLC